MKGELKTDSQMTTIIPVTMDHNHDNNERRTKMQQLCVSVKRKAGDDLTVLKYLILPDLLSALILLFFVLLVYVTILAMI